VAAGCIGRILESGDRGRVFDRTVIDPGGGSWSVGIRTRPRWRALSRRFGAWRRRNDQTDVDLGAAFEVDAGSGTVPVRFDGGGGASWLEPGEANADVDVSGASGLDDILDDLLLGILVVVLLVLTVALAWWVIIPLLLVVLDAVVVSLLFVLGFVARIAIGRPWVVRAREKVSGGRWVEADVQGWRNARDLQTDWETALAQGQFDVKRAGAP
jgi:hypothetical protein